MQVIEVPMHLHLSDSSVKQSETPNIVTSLASTLVAECGRRFHSRHGQTKFSELKLDLVTLP